MKDKMPLVTIKLPSQLSLVTVRSLKNLARALPKIGDTFEKSDLADCKEYPVSNEKAIGRVLAYARYLGIVEERRGPGGEGRRVQQWTLTKDGEELKEKLVYFKDEDFEEKWRDIIGKSSPYKFFLELDDLQKYGRVPYPVFQKTVSDALGKKHSPRFVKEGSKFLVGLLEDAGLVEFDGENINPIGIGQMPKHTGIEPQGDAGSGLPVGHFGLGKKSVIPQGAGGLTDTALDHPDEYTYIKDTDLELRITLTDLSLSLLKSHIRTLELKLESLKKMNGEKEPNAREV